MYTSPVARLHIMNLEDERRVEVILSRRNLLSLIHKLDMPGSLQQIETTDCWEDGIPSPSPSNDENGGTPGKTTLVLRCEDDSAHYGKRSAGPGPMHPATESFVEEHGVLLPRSHLSFDDARDLIAGWHFNQRRLSAREQEILQVAEALLRRLEQESQ